MSLSQDRSDGCGERHWRGHRRSGVERVAQSLGIVTHRSVETLIGRLATDPLVRRRFIANPAAVLREFQEQGCELTAVEVDALAATDPEVLRSFAQSIDRRIRKTETQRSPGK